MPKSGCLRAVLAAVLCGLTVLNGGCSLVKQKLEQQGDALRFQAAVQRIERGTGGRLGVSVHDMATGRTYTYRANERFPMTSTFKMLACSAVLQRVDRGELSLDKPIIFNSSVVVENSPITGRAWTQGTGAERTMRVRELCDAAVRYSDNTAGNLILNEIGGPKGLTKSVRGLGDATTRLDRWETALNEALPGDVRDTTTPHAMANNLEMLTLGTVVKEASRKQLIDWMLYNTTGNHKLRAGVPAIWRVADKTGGGERGTNNDIALIWRDRTQKRKPLVVTVYLTGATVPQSARDAALADVAKVITQTLGASF